DADTVRAVFTNRMHVLRDYRRRVITPVFRDLKKGRSPTAPVLRSVKLLVRHPTLLDVRACEQLHDLLSRHEPLRTVVGFRDRLQRMWDETSSSHGRAVEQLRQLCRDADASGI